MTLIKKLSAEWVLRLSLGAMYLYSGVDIVRHPDSWTWAIRSLPQSLQSFITNQIGVLNFLYIQGISEIIIALILIFWFSPRNLVRLVALLSAIEMVAIVLLVGLDAITFRDLGLIGSGLALFLLL